MSINTEKERLMGKLALLKNSEPVQALWFAGDNNWEKAHQLAQKQEGNPKYDRIHAYLHRVEGDEFNARYWYNRLKLNVPTMSLDEEWTSLALEYLKYS